MSGKNSIPGFLGATLGAIFKSVFEGKCDCANCRKTEYTSVVLTGDAAKAVTDFDALYTANRAKIAELETEIVASSKTMWDTVQAATGTQDIDGLKIDSDHASAGFIFLRVPVTKADDATDEGAGQSEGTTAEPPLSGQTVAAGAGADLAAVDGDLAAAYQDAIIPAPEQPPSIATIAA
ncbi:hypothetical protein TSA6c_17195 [Azospirillum sp. TSA6c]|uniref:hypothetical protein n=1 Tax=Azospirillum sp. TSA6c TaxID=709813 RepID=UPI000D611E44|nr:hypothetical protein [Azospirillum sp. TSA6c]PWC48164.1 hypothetical protein TSA6c_17195 [Azospirillum sp. TSA6c]